MKGKEGKNLYRNMGHLLRKPWPHRHKVVRGKSQYELDGLGDKKRAYAVLQTVREIDRVGIKVTNFVTTPGRGVVMDRQRRLRLS